MFSIVSEHPIAPDRFERYLESSVQVRHIGRSDESLGDDLFHQKPSDCMRIIGASEFETGISAKGTDKEVENLLRLPEATSTRRIGLRHRRHD
jgi:hypothetical protein